MKFSVPQVKVSPAVAIATPPPLSLSRLHVFPFPSHPVDRLLPGDLDAGGRPLTIWSFSDHLSACCVLGPWETDLFYSFSLCAWLVWVCKGQNEPFNHYRKNIFGKVLFDRSHDWGVKLHRLKPVNGCRRFPLEPCLKSKYIIKHRVVRRVKHHCVKLQQQ